MKGTRKKQLPQKSSLSEIKSWHVYGYHVVAHERIWSLIFIQILYKSQFPTSYQTHCVSITKTYSLILPGEIMLIVRIVRSTYIQCVDNAEFLLLKLAAYTLNRSCDLKGLMEVYLWFHYSCWRVICVHYAISECYIYGFLCYRSEGTLDLVSDRRFVKKRTHWQTLNHKQTTRTQQFLVINENCVSLSTRHKSPTPPLVASDYVQFSCHSQTGRRSSASRRKV